MRQDTWNACREEIAAFCQRHHIRRLRVFGSAARRALGPDSDLDLLVEFEPGRTPGLSFFALQEELCLLLGRKIDLNTPQCLGNHFRDDVLREAEVLYAVP